MFTFLNFAFGCLFLPLLPLKRTKCILKQPNFENLQWEIAPSSPWRLAPLALVWSVASLDRTLSQKDLPTDL